MLRFILFVAMSLVLAACGDDDMPADNSIEGSEGVGVKSFEVKFPAFERLLVVAECDTIIIEMQGVDDMQTYDIYADVEHNDGTVTISSSDESLAELPHQRYYLNFVKFPSDDDDTTSKSGSLADGRSVTMGALVSLEDPNDIALVSDYNDDLDCFGYGTVDSPISVVTMRCIEEFILEELTKTDEVQHLKGVHFQQTRSINFELEYEAFEGWTAAGKFNVKGIKPQFCGVYNGGRNSISDLIMSSNSSAALFYELGDGAIIRDVKMEGLDINGGEYAGAIACKSSGDVTIQNVDVSGTITGYGSVGGMIGEGCATFKDCYSQMTISDGVGETSDGVERAMGGFIGHATGSTTFNVCAYSGYITNDNGCYTSGGYIGSTADFSGSDVCGILFVDCAVKGSVGSSTSSVDYAGGLIGYCGKNIDVLVDDVIVGSQYTMLSSDDDSESIFGDNPTPSLASLTICSDGVSGGYFGYVKGSEKLSFGGNYTYVSNQCTIMGSSSIGGIIGRCEGVSASDMVSISVVDKLDNLGYMYDVDTDTTGDYIGGFVGYSSFLTLSSVDDAPITNNPSLMPSLSTGGALGSFAGYYYDSLCDEVNFINKYDSVSSFMGDCLIGDPYQSSSSFVNN